MEEKEIIAKIELLKNLKPDQKWVSETRVKILGKREFLPFFRFDLFKVPAAVMLLLFGLFAYWQFSLVPSNQKRELVQERERKIAELSVVLIELAETKENLRQNLAKSGTATADLKSGEKTVKIVNEIASSLVGVEETKRAVADSLGMITEEPTEDLVSQEVASFLIADLKQRGLTEEEKVILALAEEAFKAQNYHLSLEKLLEIGRNREMKEDIIN